MSILLRRIILRTHFCWRPLWLKAQIKDVWRWNQFPGILGIIYLEQTTKFVLSFCHNYLDMNVISDFRGRKHMVFYDTKDATHYIMGMKIIPLQTSDLRSIIMTGKKYAELYPKYEKAYLNDMAMMPVSWYESCIKENTEISSLIQAPELSEFVDDTKAASKDSLQSVPFIVQYESRNNQVHFLAAKIGIISESSKYFCNFL